MEADQLEDFSELVLRDACSHWKLGEARRISEAENLVYETTGPHGKVALRLTHPKHRSAEMLQAELHWLASLSEQGISTIKPIPSHSGTLLETLDFPASRWHASAFEWIDGRPIKGRDQKISENLIQDWGSLTAAIVRSSLANQDAPYRLARHHWNQARDGQQSVAEKVHTTLPHLAEEIITAQTTINALPKSPDNYTLIHSDLHSGNVFLTSEQTLVALDFDDACHHYILQEFAMPLYYSFFFPNSDLESEAKHYFRNFLKGYRNFHDIPTEDFECLPLFFKLRDLDLTAIRHLWNIPLDHPWSQATESLYKNGNPLSELPWKKWARTL